jgi:hypothetical protein
MPSFKPPINVFTSLILADNDASALVLLVVITFITANYLSGFFTNPRQTNLSIYARVPSAIRRLVPFYYPPEAGNNRYY